MALQRLVVRDFYTDAPHRVPWNRLMMNSAVVVDRKHQAVRLFPRDHPATSLPPILVKHGDEVVATRLKRLYACECRHDISGVLGLELHAANLARTAHPTCLVGAPHAWHLGSKRHRPTTPNAEKSDYLRSIRSPRFGRAERCVVPPGPEWPSS